MPDDPQSGIPIELLTSLEHLSFLQPHAPKSGRDHDKISATQPSHLVYAAQIWALAAPPDLPALLKEFNTRTEDRYNQILSKYVSEQLVALEWLNEIIEDFPYLAPLRVLLSTTYSHLRYPDLAAGSAYKALLLLDAVSDDSDEYHESAVQSFEQGIDHWASLIPGSAKESAIETGLKAYRLQVYVMLARSLLRCGCLQSSHMYCARGLAMSPASAELQKVLEEVEAAAKLHFGEATLSDDHSNPLAWPENGQVRRECYPWNTYEPSRLDDLAILNDMMKAVAPKLEVKAARLPELSLTTSDGPAGEVIQLGVFARENIQPGETVLKETSLLTANNKLQDALCDACSVDLPELSEDTHTVACDDCQVVFCSQTCYDMALESYHPALCERDVESIAKDVPLIEAPDSLYSLLLLRALAMAETQECHPLDLQEVKYIWGDFNDIDYSSSSRPRTLPFSFKYNITTPLHMLEKMDVDIFANSKYDVWVFNTLYAKFRGTASARLSGLGGRAIRGPEVCAVHSMWCLANHSCDPNVSWEWGGEIAFRAREQRTEWQGKSKSFHNQAGIEKGEEVLNHYCDVDLPVQERREWARGALGGDCMCERCIWESQQQRDLA